MARNLQDYERDYWAPDRESVLNDIRAGVWQGQKDPENPVNQGPQGQPPTWGSPGGPAGNTGINGGSHWGNYNPGQQQPQQNPFDQNAFSSGWINSGGKTVQDLQNYINQGGWGQYGITTGGSKGDKVYRNGQFLADAVLAAGAGGRGAQWLTDVGGGDTGGGGGGFSASSSSSTSGISGELYDMLMARAKQGLDVDRNTKVIRDQVDPYVAQQERFRRDYLADKAEELGPNANLGGESRMAMERAGNASGLFESQLIGREITARRDEIMHALDSLRGQLTSDQELALRKELGYLNDATQRYGIDADSRKAENDLSYNRERLGYDIGRTDMDYWLRSQGL